MGIGLSELSCVCGFLKHCTVLSESAYLRFFTMRTECGVPISFGFQSPVPIIKVQYGFLWLHFCDCDSKNDRVSVFFKHCIVLRECAYLRFRTMFGEIEFLCHAAFWLPRQAGPPLGVLSRCQSSRSKQLQRQKRPSRSQLPRSPRNLHRRTNFEAPTRTDTFLWMDFFDCNSKNSFRSVHACCARMFHIAANPCTHCIRRVRICWSSCGALAAARPHHRQLKRQKRHIATTRLDATSNHHP